MFGTDSQLSHTGDWRTVIPATLRFPSNTLTRLDTTAVFPAAPTRPSLISKPFRPGTSASHSAWLSTVQVAARTTGRTRVKRANGIQRK